MPGTALCKKLAQSIVFNAGAISMIQRCIRHLSAPQNKIALITAITLRKSARNGSSRQVSERTLCTGSATTSCRSLPGVKSSGQPSSGNARPQIPVILRISQVPEKPTMRGCCIGSKLGISKFFFCILPCRSTCRSTQRPLPHHSAWQRLENASMVFNKCEMLSMVEAFPNRSEAVVVMEVEGDILKPKEVPARAPHGNESLQTHVPKNWYYHCNVFWLHPCPSYSPDGCLEPVAQRAYLALGRRLIRNLNAGHASPASIPLGNQHKNFQCLLSSPI
mmetsp:Transcript_108457/g.188270  ORF Transcript_108457/g.188270 Transcript_108457/m.188270 type:complete len:277 (+) Transcript_108457:154-984(+)